MCQPSSVYGVTRFVAPWSNLLHAGWGVKGFEGREVKGSLAPQKHSTAQRANIRVTGRWLFIVQAVIFIVSPGKSLSPAFGTKSGRFCHNELGPCFYFGRTWSFGLVSTAVIFTIQAHTRANSNKTKTIFTFWRLSAYSYFCVAEDSGANAIPLNCREASRREIIPPQNELFKKHMVATLHLPRFAFWSTTKPNSRAWQGTLSGIICQSLRQWSCC